MRALIYTAVAITNLQDPIAQYYRYTVQYDLLT